MTHKKIYHHHSYSGKAFILLLLMLLQLHTITMLKVVVVNSSSEFEDAKSESLSTISGSSWSSSSDGGRSSSSEGEFLSKEIAAPLLTFTLRTGNNNGSLEQSNHPDDDDDDDNYNDEEDNNAGIYKAKVGTDERREDELHEFYSNKDNEGDNNDSNVSSESDSDTGYGYGKGLGRRYRRDAVVQGDGFGSPSSESPSPLPSPPPGGEASKAISTNWGTYEEQAPVVVHSGSRSSIDESDANSVDGVGRMATDADSNANAYTFTQNDDHDHYDDDDSYAYGDEYQSKENENESSEYDGENPITYDDDDDYEHEGGHFEGRQFYPSQGVAADDDNVHVEHEPSGYYRQKYYATARPLSQQQQGKEPSQQQQRPGYRRPGNRNRFGQQRPNNYPRPSQQVKENNENDEEESTGSSLMGFFQKAKTFYDIFQAMNSAWKTVEQHYRKTSSGKGVFPEDYKYLNQSTQTAPNTANQSVNNKTNKMNTKRLRTTRVPIIVPTSKEHDHKQQQQQREDDDEQQEQQQQDTWQEKEEYRSRRSWLKETVNDSKESTYNMEEDNSDFQITESDSGTDSSSASTSTSSFTSTPTSSSSSSTAIAEGRYIKGDPLKGYYDFVITEGSYKFWAVFQVGTALLIIYSTFAAIYYSKVNPLVSDYDYVDYLGGGRSLSDDSDFVDMDAPIAVGAGGPSAAETTQPEGVSSSRQHQQQREASAGWIGWLPHAGHTLRFILESIDKVYNEE
ncbi:myb-like protein AA [Eupeodes corollae]|uniref:myb-like protein AA n=1 Tax=Eupeodes corollae TaxID=290404 RepID=UPI00249295B3|nr:myb-like protein AA [Eupeodes corollae]